MLVTTAFKHLLALPGVTVTEVTFLADLVVVRVKLRRRKLKCPYCRFQTWGRERHQLVDSSWRHLDLGRWELRIVCLLRRLRCPEHGTLVEAVPFARPRAGFTRDFEQLVAFLATRMDQTSIQRLSRIAWRTIGKIIARVVADELDPDRLNNLFVIGVDDVSWRKRHKYLTLVTDHATGKAVWGGDGSKASTLDGFFAELGPERSKQIEAIGLDMGKAYPKSIAKTGHAPQAVLCWDPFHVVALASKAVEDVRREHWRDLKEADPDLAKKVKGLRWVLLTGEERLSAKQVYQLNELRKGGSAMYRAQQHKEVLRDVFKGDVTADEADELLDRFCSRAQRSRLPAFVKLARTIRERKPGILAAVRLGISNARSEALNTTVRLVIRRARGFHTAEAALALIMLTCGPIQLVLPHES